MSYRCGKSLYISGVCMSYRCGKSLYISGVCMSYRCGKSLYRVCLIFTGRLLEQSTEILKIFACLCGCVNVLKT